MDQHGFAGTQLCLSPESVMGGDKDFRHCGGVGPVKVGRNFRKQILIGNNIFGMGTAADEAKDTLARLPSTNGVADFGDFASKFHTRNLRRTSGWSRIGSLALKQVGAVDRS